MSFDLQPSLKGYLLELRPLHADDFDALLAVAADPLIWEQHPAKERCEKEGFKNFFRETEQSGGALIVIDANDRRIIGSSRFHGYGKEKSEIEIGWTFLARPYWGGDYNREMKELMLRHAFKSVCRVVFRVDSHNLRSQSAVEKIGGARVGSMREVNGRSTIIYKITAVDFFEIYRQIKASGQ